MLDEWVRLARGTDFFQYASHLFVVLENVHSVGTGNNTECGKRRRLTSAGCTCTWCGKGRGHNDDNQLPHPIRTIETNKKIQPTQHDGDTNTELRLENKNKKRVANT
jgi:hypothetical protein